MERYRRQCIRECTETKEKLFMEKSMNKQKSGAIYYNKIPKNFYDKNGFINIDVVYELTVAELGLQQTKRDQILALYLSILTFVIPNIVGLAELGDLQKSMAFLALYIVGVALCHVILRYRVYKEVYWVACRVLTELDNIYKEKRTYRTLCTLFYHALRKNQDSIVRKNMKTGKISYWESFKRQLDSAETLLFEILVFFSSVVGGISAIYIGTKHMWIGIGMGGIILVVAFILNKTYCVRLVELYKCIDDNPLPEEVVKQNMEEQEDYETICEQLKKTGETEKLNKLEEQNEIFKTELDRIMGKAWMLHCFIDDIVEE